jgi:integrase
MAHNKLTARTVATATKRGRYGDGGGLFLQVSKWGTKSWLFRYARGGRERQMGLGPLHTVTLAQAREMARDARFFVLQGKDPISERNAQAATARAAGATFRECAEQFLAAHGAGWTPKNLEIWRTTLRNYAYPIIGDMPVASVDTAMVMKCIEPIWRIRSETAKKLRARIAAVLDNAKVLELRHGDNPARWRGHLDKLLPKPSKVRTVEHLAALPYGQMHTFLTDLRQRPGLSVVALEFTILTAVRTSEALGARWAEIDLATATWTIPKERMKSRREHRVPLAPRVLEILEALPRESEFIFPGQKDGSLTSMVMLSTLRRIGRGDLTVHGFRSTFRDWAAETTAYPNHVVEMALAHAIGDQVEAAYRRGDLFEKRRRLMADWSAYCTQPSADMGDVIPIRGSV